jgi:heptosyltransferase II
MIIKKILLLAAAGCYALLRGKALTRPCAVERVAVIQMAKLGDMVCTTPLLRAIKRAHPKAQVTVVGNALNQEVLKGNNDRDEYVVFGGIGAMVKRLRCGNYDAVVVAGAPDFSSVAVAYLAGAPLVVAPEVKEGDSPLNDVWYRLLCRLVTTVPHRMGHYAPREYLRLLEPLGIHAEDTTKHLAYSLQAAQTAQEFLAPIKRPIVGISPGAGNKIKQWPPERFAAVADALLRERGASVVVLGGARDREEAREMLAHCKEPVVEALEKFSIDELKAIIAGLDLFVAVDTGPIYIAEAFGVPTVDIVGPMDEREQPPRSEKHIVVVPPSRTKPAIQLFRAKWYNHAEARRQAESISVQAVLKACIQLLNQKEHENGT